MEHQQAAVVRPETVRVKVSFGRGTMTVGSNLWLKWAKIAIRQERRARVAREEGLRAEERAPAIGLETEETIQAVAAVRHCLHNLWLDWQRQALFPFESEEGLRAHHLTHHPPRDVESWEARVKEVINWRNHVVHHVPEMLPSVPHPAYPTGVSDLNATFTVERATEAVDLMMDLFERVLSAPSQELQDWAEKRSHVFAQLVGFREEQKEF